MAVKHDEEYERFLKALGKRIREMRQARGWSQRDMVLLHGYNDSQWRKYERGGGITLQSLVKLSKVFDQHLSIVLDGVGLTFPGTLEAPSPGAPSAIKKHVQKGPGRPKKLESK